MTPRPFLGFAPLPSKPATAQGPAREQRLAASAPRARGRAAGGASCASALPAHSRVRVAERARSHAAAALAHPCRRAAA